jgi:tRNA (cytidine/uridine-2'-O-)-methyltransferase
VVLHQPEIPQNTGNVGRTCVAAGAKLWLVRPLGFRMDDASLRRAGLDYWPALNWEVVDDWSALESRLAGQRFWYLSKTASRSYEEARFAEGDVLVFGCETQGLPRAMLEEQAAWALRIPIRDPVRSLNLGNAVAVVVFEALRQQRAAPH